MGSHAAANCLSRLARSSIPLKELAHAPPEQREPAKRRDNHDAHIGACGNHAQFVGQGKEPGINRLQGVRANEQLQIRFPKSLSCTGTKGSRKGGLSICWAGSGRAAAGIIDGHEVEQ